MHIGFITVDFPFCNAKSIGGIGTSIKNLLTALTKNGVKVSVFVYGQEEDASFEEEGVTIHLIKNRKYKALGWFFHRKHLQNYLNKFIVSERIDVIEAPDWTGITAFMNLKVPLVIRFHGSDTYFCHLEQRKQKIKNFWFEKLALKKAKVFIAPTHFAGEISKKLFNIKNKKIRTIHYGLDLTQFKNDGSSVFQNGLILYIGAIIRKKGVLELPDIFKKVKEKYPIARLVLIGSDSYDIQTKSKSTWGLVQQKCSKEDLSAISYLGKISYQEVQEFIKKAHVCVFPTFAETLGMVTIESMAMQKPVVNSNIGWAKELIVDGESGYLVHPENHDLYAQKIIALLKDDVLCENISKKALKRVEEKFDIDKLVLENIKFYQKIINKNIK